MPRIRPGHFRIPTPRWHIDGASVVRWVGGSEWGTGLKLRHSRPLFGALRALNVRPAKLAVGAFPTPTHLLFHGLLSRIIYMTQVRLVGQLVCANETEVQLVITHLPLHIELSRAESGCLHFEVEPNNDGLTWNVNECFIDQKSFDEHQARVSNSEWGLLTAGIRRHYKISQ